MMDWTDRHCRYFMRLLTPNALLYTEMVVSSAILRGDQTRLLGFSSAEQPVAIQLGGSNPVELAEAASIAASLGYQEINLNVGCPSDRVQSGRFGACLMREPDLVAECVAAMQSVVTIPVTVKTRIGVDHDDSYEFLADFVAKVAATDCNTFIIHARKAWLNGLSPKQNREVPPLCYERVVQLKRDFPTLQFILNGGITTIEQVQTLLPSCDGIMLGRAAYHNPLLLVGCEQALYDPEYHVDYADVLKQYSSYMKSQQGVPLSILVKPLLGLFNGFQGAKAWRRCLTENARQESSNADIVMRAVEKITFAD